MYPTIPRLASHTRSTLKTPSLGPFSLLLLNLSLTNTPRSPPPPLHLYRRLLRTHRQKLLAELRVLGDEYVKSEFRLHRDIDNSVHIVGFLTEWQLYAQKLEGDAWRGEKLDRGKIEKMSDQQVGQLMYD
ncbi:hypothetical protein BDD12DRAFT_803575 [Trichophaea hybrida]|nr:hypothetical protein BDD12DRAFT_803575 [Trichophaea hybrida]